MKTDSRAEGVVGDQQRSCSRCVKRDLGARNLGSFLWA